MTRKLLPSERIHNGVKEKIGGGYSEVLDEINTAIDTYPIVIVGMKTNPFVKKVKKLVSSQDLEFHYIEYGGYFSNWYKRLVIKMWSGMNTFPQVFVQGTLVGGYEEAKRLIESGEISTLLKTD